MAKPERVDLVRHVLQYPNGDAVQVLRWTGERIQLSATDSASTATALPAGSRVIEIRADEDCYIAFGDSSVEAAADETAVLFLRGSQVVGVPLDANNEPFTHVSVIRKADQNAVVQFERCY